MKKLIQLSLLCILFVTGCKGWKDALVGTLEVYTPFLVKSEPKEIYLGKGSHKVSIDLQYGILGFSDSKVNLTYKDKTYSFKASNVKTDDRNTLIVQGSDMNQDFTIYGQQRAKMIKTWTQVENVSCTYCGYCMTTTTGVDSQGNATITTSYANSCSCHGSQDVLKRYKQMLPEYNIHFLTADNKKVIGLFKGLGQKYNESYKVKEMNSCL